MFGTAPIELGLRGQGARILGEMSRDKVYRRLVPLAFPGDTAPWTVRRAVQAIAAFERTLISVRSPYDRYRYQGERDAISASAKRGEPFLFSRKKGGCFQCHDGWNFSGVLRVVTDTTVAPSFFNTGF